MNINKQIEYWINGAQEAVLTAQILVQKNRLLHGMFFCHLVIEKAIKAHVVKATGQIPPKSHNLMSLSEKAGIEFENEEDIFFLGILMKYQLQGRYPDYNPILPDKEKVKKYLKQTKELLKWLIERL